MKKAIILSLLLCSIAQGASEIRSFTNCTAAFAVVREVDGDVWYVSGQVFEAWGTGARTAADYDIALTAESGGMFTGSFDTNIGAGYYYVITHDDSDSTPTDTDPAVWQDYGYWTGSAWTSGADAADIDAILVDTAVIGALGAGLTAIPWNSAWDTEVQSEATDALNAYDPPTDTEMLAAHTTTDALIITVDGVVDTILIDTSAYDTDAEYAAAIWNAAVASYGGAGTYGQVLEDINDVNDAGIADAVWDELVADHTGETTFGGEVGGLDPNITLIKYKTDLISLVDTVVKDTNDVNNFTIEDGTDVNDAYWFMAVIVEDADGSSDEIRWIDRYDENSADPNVWVDEPFSFTPTTGDVVHIMGTCYGGYLYRIERNLDQTRGVLNVVDTTGGTGGAYRAGAVRIDATGDDP